MNGINGSIMSRLVCTVTNIKGWRNRFYFLRAESQAVWHFIMSLYLWSFLSLYHVPDGKVGCTTKPKATRVRLKYSNRNPVNRNDLYSAGERS